MMNLLKNLVDQALESGYLSSLIVLFLYSPEQSKDRVAIRGMQQSGMYISGSNVNINFNESLKNIANYFIYLIRATLFIQAQEVRTKRL